jgi:hypothetical protein
MEVSANHWSSQIGQALSESSSSFSLKSIDEYESEEASQWSQDDSPISNNTSNLIQKPQAPARK